MSQQKSENRIVPEGRRKAVPSQHVEQSGGGKTVPVKEADPQLTLPFATAEMTPCASPKVSRAADLSRKKTRKVPKANSKPSRPGPARMEEVIERLAEAFDRVAANKGAPGPDRQGIKQVRQHLSKVLSQLRRQLLDGTYQPGDIRRVWIPKATGGQRGLGIPNVVDRVVQEAVRACRRVARCLRYYPTSC